jgi:anti-sigma regulatory factor (Ser/Thr protein kinase)
VGETASELLHVELPCSVHAPSLARDALDQLDGVGSVRDDARLITTELVSNAVVHSGCERDHVIELSAELQADRLRIWVMDPGNSASSLAPRDAGEPSAELGGFGLRIVEALARDWGVERPSGSSVWAELLLPV